MTELSTHLSQCKLLGQEAFRHGSPDRVMLISGGPASHLANWSMLAAPPKKRAIIRQPSRLQMPAAEPHSPISGTIQLIEEKCELRAEIEEWKHGSWYHSVTLIASSVGDLLNKLQPITSPEPFDKPGCNGMASGPFWSGAMAYDMMQWTQPLLLQNPPQEGTLLSVMWLIEGGIFHDRHSDELDIFGADSPWADGAQEALKVKPTETVETSLLRHVETTTHDDETHIENIERVRQGIIAGQVYQVNVGKHWQGPIEHPFEVFKHLTQSNPAPYSVYLEADDVGFALASSSPESLLDCNEEHIRSSPIKGTCLQGSTPEEAAVLRNAMLGDEKERAEHRMLADLMRNDLSSVCEVGSVDIDRFDIEVYSNVQHLVSHITGTFRPEHNGKTAFQSIFPGGSITGCPRTMVCAVIDELEQHPRSFWTGSAGWVDVHTGSSSWNILIRTLEAHRTTSGWAGSIGAGGGITIASDAAKEVSEAVWKGAALRVASGWMEADENPIPRGELEIHPIGYQNLTAAKGTPASVQTLDQCIESNGDCGVLFIDNLDSFSLNVADAIAQSGHDVTVLAGRNKKAELLSDPTALFDLLDRLKPTHIVLGPGPGAPDDAPLTMALAHHALAGQLSIPVLGVCLGHQALALADGMEVIPSPHGPVHGVPVRIEHDGTGLFATSTSPEAFTRYNSLVVNENEGHSFIINGRESETGLVMGIRHSSHPIHGVQFHPESIGSPEGRAIIQEFLQNPSDG